MPPLSRPEGGAIASSGLSSRDGNNFLRLRSRQKRPCLLHPRIDGGVRLLPPSMEEVIASSVQDSDR